MKKEKLTSQSIKKIQEFIIGKFKSSIPILNNPDFHRIMLDFDLENGDYVRIQSDKIERYDPNSAKKFILEYSVFVTEQDEDDDKVNAIFPFNEDFIIKTPTIQVHMIYDTFESSIIRGNLAKQLDAKLQVTYRFLLALTDISQTYNFG